MERAILPVPMKAVYRKSILGISRSFQVQEFKRIVFHITDLFSRVYHDHHIQVDCDYSVDAYGGVRGQGIATLEMHGRTDFPLHDKPLESAIASFRPFDDLFTLQLGTPRAEHWEGVLEQKLRMLPIPSMLLLQSERHQPMDIESHGRYRLLSEELAALDWRKI